MGLAFISRAGKTLKKSWSKGFERFAEPDLLTGDAKWEDRSLLFELLRGADLSAGEAVVIRLDGDALWACKGVERVAVAVAPSASVVVLVRQARGIAHGRVESVNEFSGTANIVVKIPVLS